MGLNTESTNFSSNRLSICLVVFPMHHHIHPFAGQDLKVGLLQHPSDERAPVHWRAISLVDSLPTLYTVFEDEGRFVPVKEPVVAEDGANEANAAEAAPNDPAPEVAVVV